MKLASIIILKSECISVQSYNKFPKQLTDSGILMAGYWNTHQSGFPILFCSSRDFVQLRMSYDFFFSALVCNRNITNSSSEFFSWSKNGQVLIGEFFYFHWFIYGRLNTSSLMKECGKRSTFFTNYRLLLHYGNISLLPAVHWK